MSDDLYGGHNPAEPPGAEAAMAALAEQLDQAQDALREARDLEVAAKHVRDANRRRARFSDDRPKAGVFDGVRTTVADVEAWLDEQVADDDLRYELAKAGRQAAAEHLHTLGQQLSAQQSIARSVGVNYAGQGRDSTW
jgi:hypothetical protein